MKNVQCNGNACGELKCEVMEMLGRFQAGYTKRDVSIIDTYMEDLFAKGDDIVILGTSIGEWSLGYNSAKELIQSDWEYWGDVALNLDSAIISDCGDSIWLTVDAAIRYQFESSDEKYDRFIDFVKSYLDENNVNSKLPDKYKIAHINWVLSQVFWSRKDGKRSYLWPLKISAVLRRYNGKLLFTEMQFCLPPTNEIYPDVKLGFDETMMADVKEGNAQIAEYLNRTGYKCAGDIEAIFNEFKGNYLNSDKNATDIVERYFTSNENESILSYDHKVYQGKEALTRFIDEQRGKWAAMDIENENTILRVYDNTALLATWGVLKNNINQDKAIKILLSEMQNILDKDAKSNDKLFQIQRSIALVLKEATWGEQFDCCFKLEGLLKKGEDGWKFNKLQFSFPFYYFFEGMYNVPEIE